MQFIPADSLSEWTFTLFALAQLATIVLLVWKTQFQFRKFCIHFFGYLLLFALVVQSGLPLTHTLPVVPLLFLSVLVGAVVFAFSPFGTSVALTHPLSILIGVQAFRFPLELILHHWTEIGTIPPTMTWSGQNVDIISGILSLLAIPFVNKSRLIAWAVNTVGFLLLFNVLRVVILSSPLPFAWPLEHPLLLIAYLPYALIGPLFVGFALAMHLITFRKLIH